MGDRHVEWWGWLVQEFSFWRHKGLLLPWPAEPTVELFRAGSSGGPVGTCTMGVRPQLFHAKLQIQYLEVSPFFCRTFRELPEIQAVGFRNRKILVLSVLLGCSFTSTGEWHCPLPIQPDYWTHAKYIIFPKTSYHLGYPLVTHSGEIIQGLKLLFFAFPYTSLVDSTFLSSPFLTFSTSLDTQASFCS